MNQTRRNNLRRYLRNRESEPSARKMRARYREGVFLAPLNLNEMDFFPSRVMGKISDRRNDSLNRGSLKGSCAYVRSLYSSVRILSPLRCEGRNVSLNARLDRFPRKEKKMQCHGKILK